MDLQDLSLMIKQEITENDPEENGERKLLNFGHTAGHALEAWCMTLPDYKKDLTQKRRYLAVAQKTWGVTPESRYRTYKILKFVCQHLPLAMVLIICIAMASQLWPLSYFPSLMPIYAFCLYVLPFITLILYLRSPEVYTFTPPGEEKVKISLFPLYFASGAIIGYWFFKGAVLKDGVMLDLFHSKYWYENPLYIGICVILLLIPMIEIRLRKKSIQQWMSLIFSYLFFIPIAAGGIMISYDVLFDKSKPQIYETIVIRKIMRDQGENPATTPRYLEVKSWDSIEHKGSMNPSIVISQDFYNRVKVGEKICVYTYSGAVGIPWTKADYCLGKL